MEEANVVFSAEELRLATDPQVIFTKTAIIAKVYNLFGTLSARLQPKLLLPEEVTAIPPKISRGEAYQGLPYVMLDHPRFFSSADVLAIRTFFWWGRFFSITLHLKGKYQECYAHGLANSFDHLANANFLLSIGDDEWQHDLASGVYSPISSLDRSDFAQKMLHLPFVKVATSFPILNPVELIDQLEPTALFLAGILKD